MPKGDRLHETDAVTSAVCPSWNGPWAASCVVAPGADTGYWSDSEVVAGVTTMLVRPGIGATPESPPNPPSSPVAGKPLVFAPPQPHAAPTASTTIDRSVALSKRVVVRTILVEQVVSVEVMASPVRLGCPLCGPRGPLGRNPPLVFHT